MPAGEYENHRITVSTQTTPKMKHYLFFVIPCMIILSSSNVNADDKIMTYPAADAILKQWLDDPGQMDIDTPRTVDLVNFAAQEVKGGEGGRRSELGDGCGAGGEGI